MKKALSIALFITVLLILAGLALVQSQYKLATTEELESNCYGKSADYFDAQRSLGLIVQDKALFAVRLESENNFSPPGGHIEPGENPLEALKREYDEELRVKPSVSEKDLYKIECELLDNNTKLRTYYYTVDDWTGTLQPKASTETKWVDSTYIASGSTDTELAQALTYLKSDNLIN